MYDFDKANIPAIQIGAKYLGHALETYHRPGINLIVVYDKQQLSECSSCSN